MPRARDIAFIRKLCALGLPAQTLVHSLLPALRTIVPAHSAAVFWVDDDGEMTNLYAERLLPPEAMARYYERHYRDSAKSFTDAFLRRACADDPVSTYSFSHADQESDYFKDVMAPLDAYHVMYGVLKHEGTAFAQISLYRARRDTAFTKDDADALRVVLRYMSESINNATRDARTEEGSVTIEEELGIVDRNGAVTAGSDSWKRLLRLAALSEVSPRNAQHEAAAISSFIVRVCRLSAFSDENVIKSQQHLASPWGCFVLRTFPLPPADGRAADQIGLLIRREEARFVSLVRGTGLTELSPQQREVAVLLAIGKSNREIADQLGLSINTATSHVKLVYSRLGVNDRNAVAGELLAYAQRRSADRR